MYIRTYVFIFKPIRRLYLSDLFSVIYIIRSTLDTYFRFDFGPRVVVLLNMIRRIPEYGPYSRVQLRTTAYILAVSIFGNFRIGPR